MILDEFHFLEAIRPLPCRELCEDLKCILEKFVMVKFTMKVAGISVEVHALFDSSKDYCREYLCENVPDMTVTITQEDLACEREKSAYADRAEGIPVRNPPAAYLEPTAIQRKIAEKFFTYDTLLFHGSAVAVDGMAYLFTAKSGTGKSTHTRLWRELFGKGAVMVNDDKPFLRIAEDGVLVCGSPWNGKHRLDSNVCVPLKAVCILERGEENRIKQISAKEALPMLLQQSNRPLDAKLLPKYMELLNELAERVEFYHLQCNMEPEAAKISFGAMSGKE